MDGTPVDDSIPFTAEPAEGGITDVQQLQQEVLNEKLAPTLLPFKHDLVQRIRSQLDAQEEVIESLESQGAAELGVGVYAQERARVTWLLKEYLRVRLRKLERHAAAILATMKDDEDLGLDRGLLSDAEKGFVEEYFVAVGKHFREMVLKHLPDDFNSLVKSHKDIEVRDMIEEPNTDKHVLCKVLEDVGRVRVDEEGLEVNMELGDLYVVRYDFIAQLLQSGQVGLV